MYCLLSYTILFEATSKFHDLYKSAWPPFKIDIYISKYYPVTSFTLSRHFMMVCMLPKDTVKLLFG
uniref:Uncharacterized protein n=1 Tax=Xenopus tropicalis TaxID=8364 RepID=A0A803JY05_XENTR